MINDLELINVKAKAQAEIDNLREIHKQESAEQEEKNEVLANFQEERHTDEAALWTKSNKEMKRNVESYEQRLAEQDKKHRIPR